MIKRKFRLIDLVLWTGYIYKKPNSAKSEKITRKAIVTGFDYIGNNSMTYKIPDYYGENRFSPILNDKPPYSYSIISEDGYHHQHTKEDCLRILDDRCLWDNRIALLNTWINSAIFRQRRIKANYLKEVRRKSRLPKNLEYEEFCVDNLLKKELKND